MPLRNMERAHHSLKSLLAKETDEDSGLSILKYCAWLYKVHKGFLPVCALA